MSANGTAADPIADRAVDRLSGIASRLRRIWRSLSPERRLAAGAALGLFVALFLPWYQETVIVAGKAAKLQSATESLTGWGAFSLVEAAVLLVAVGVLTLLVQRAEGRAFHLPGGDGGVITLAGGWTSLLVIWRIFDKQGASSHGQLSATAGIEWGILVALGVAALLTFAGSRIRAAHVPESALPGEIDFTGPPPQLADRRRRPRAVPTGQSTAATHAGLPTGRRAVPATGREAPATRRAPDEQLPKADGRATADEQHVTPAEQRSNAAARRARKPVHEADAWERGPRQQRPRGWLTAPPQYLTDGAPQRSSTVSPSEPATEPDRLPEPATEPDRLPEPATEADRLPEPATEPDRLPEPATEADRLDFGEVPEFDYDRRAARDPALAETPVTPDPPRSRRTRRNRRGSTVDEQLTIRLQDDPREAD